MLNRSLLVDGVNEIFVVTTRISLVTFLLTIYCAKEFFSEINKEYFLKGTLTGFLAITIPGWTFIYALKSISSGLQSIFISTIMWSDLSNNFVWVLLFVLVTLGILGFIDDMFKIKFENSRGLNSKLKFIGQLIIAFLALIYLIYFY